MQFLGLLAIVAAAVQMSPASAAPLNVARDAAVRKRLTQAESNEFTALMLQGIAEGELAAAGELSATSSAAAPATTSAATTAAYASPPIIVIEQAAPSVPPVEAEPAVQGGEANTEATEPTTPAAKAAAALEVNSDEPVEGEGGAEVEAPQAGAEGAEEAAPAEGEAEAPAPAEGAPTIDPTALLTSSLATQQASIASEEALLASQLASSTSAYAAAAAVPYERRSYAFTSFSPFANYVQPSVAAAYGASSAPADPALFRSAKFGQGLKSASVSSALDSGIAAGEDSKATIDSEEASASEKRSPIVGPYGNAIIKAPASNPFLLAPFSKSIALNSGYLGAPAATAGEAAATESESEVEETNGETETEEGAEAEGEVEAAESEGEAGESEVEKRTARPFVGLAASGQSFAPSAAGYAIDPITAAATAAYNPIAAAYNPSIAAAAAYAPVAQAAAINQAAALSATYAPLAAAAPAAAAEGAALAEGEVGAVESEAAAAPVEERRRRRNTVTRARALKALERRSPIVPNTAYGAALTPAAAYGAPAASYGATLAAYGNPYVTSPVANAAIPAAFYGGAAPAAEAAVAEDEGEVAAETETEAATEEIASEVEKRALLVRQIMDESAVLLPVVQDMLSRLASVSSLPVGEAFPLNTSA